MANSSRPTAHVAANVRRLRKARGWTLGQFAELLQEVGHPLSVPVLSKMELGDRGIDVDDLVALADVFGVAAADLLEDPRLLEHEHVVTLVESYISAQARRVAAIAAAEDYVRLAVQNLRDHVAASAEAMEALESLAAGASPSGGRRRWIEELLRELKEGES